MRKFLPILPMHVIGETLLHGIFHLVKSLLLPVRQCALLAKFFTQYEVRAIVEIFYSPCIRYIVHTSLRYSTYAKPFDFPLLFLTRRTSFSGPHWKHCQWDNKKIMNIQLIIPVGIVPSSLDLQNDVVCLTQTKYTYYLNAKNKRGYNYIRYSQHYYT